MQGGVVWCAGWWCVAVVSKVAPRNALMAPSMAALQMRYVLMAARCMNLQQQLASSSPTHGDDERRHEGDGAGAGAGAGAGLNAEECDRRLAALEHQVMEAEGRVQAAEEKVG